MHILTGMETIFDIDLRGVWRNGNTKKIPKKYEQKSHAIFNRFEKQIAPPPETDALIIRHYSLYTNLNISGYITMDDMFFTQVDSPHCTVTVKEIGN